MQQLNDIEERSMRIAPVPNEQQVIHIVTTTNMMRTTHGVVKHDGDR